MRKIYLHGVLADKFGPMFELEVATAGEALRALGVNFPTFFKTIADGAWHVVRGKEIETGFSMDVDQVAGFKLGRGDLHIVPLITGSKNNGMLKVILGVALVGAAFAFSGGALLAPMVGGAFGGLTLAGNVAMLGATMALAGVSQMLAPEEKSKQDKDSSFTMSGPTNNYAQGAPVPLVYGEVITGSVVISGGIDIEKIAVGT